MVLEGVGGCWRMLDDVAFVSIHGAGGAWHYAIMISAIDEQ